MNQNDIRRIVDSAAARASGPRGVVVAPQPLAVEVGADILREGGNAIDAALATAFAQGVVDPFMGGIGGFGCICVHSVAAGKTETIGFHGRAGSLARPDIFANDVLGQIHGHGERYEVRGGINQIGHTSVVVPGTVAGFSEAHARYGRLPWKRLFDHAIAMARDGIALPGEVYERWTEGTEAGHRDGWARINATPACAAILAPGGKMLEPGQTLRQPDYATTLDQLAKAGAQDFYTGDIAHAIVADFKANGGLFTMQDLAAYRPIVLPPVTTRYRGLDVHSMPLPASGPQLAMMLNIFENIDLGAVYKADPTLYVHVVARAIQLCFATRARYFGDPDYVTPPLDQLLSAKWAKEQIDRVCGTDPIEVPGMAYREARTTTNVCIIDAEGNAIALTHTLGSSSGVVTPGLGFVFNNCMYQYNPIPGTPNSIAPGKSRLTGISPTILLRDNTAWAAVGGLGGTRILTAVMHAILNVVDLRMTPTAALDAPRFHAESPWLELETRLAHAHGRRLSGWGWKLRPSTRGYDRAFAIGHMAIREADGSMSGGSDPRGGGGIAFA